MVSDAELFTSVITVNTAVDLAIRLQFMISQGSTQTLIFHLYVKLFTWNSCLLEITFIYS